MHSKTINWGDGENPESNDGCGFFIVRLTVAAALILSALALGGTVWSGKRAGR